MIFIWGCGNNSYAPVVHNVSFYSHGIYSGPYRLPSLKTGERLIRVEKGDSLFEISRRYKVRYVDLIIRNQLKNPNKIYVGQRLVLPYGKQKITSQKTRVVAKKKLSSQAKKKLSSQKKKSFKHAKKNSPKIYIKTSSRPSRAGFIWPVSGHIVLGYGPKEGGIFNDGINIASNRGRPVKASNHGVISYVGSEILGFGYLTLIDHKGGYTSAYAHTSRPKVKKGQKVKRGQIISYVDSSGVVDTPQLHFEIRKGSNPLNPIKYLPKP